MKKLTLLIAMFIGIMNCELVIAQVWELDGNNAINPPTDFLGTTDNTPIPFFTSGNERMRLTPTGWLGLNIIAPDMMLHVDDGGILSTGTTGTNPDLGSGTRMMWIPDQAAFRAGRATGMEWDGTDVGDYSFAFGRTNEVSGEYSGAFMNNNTISGDNAFSIGSENNISADNGLAFGSNNQITSSASHGTSLGSKNVISAADGFTTGQFLESAAANSMVIGKGVNTATRLVNNVTNSLMVGFNSDLSTLFVGSSSGENSFGSVGIGDITAPTERIDVNGTARLRVMPYDTADVFITGVQADTATGDYVLNYIPVDSLSLGCDWNVVNGGQDVATAYDDWCVERSVLIGTDQPQGAKLYVTRNDDIAGLSVQTSGGNTTQIGGIIGTEGGTTSTVSLWSSAFDSPNNFGVLGHASGEGSSSNTGVRGNARDGGNNRGVVGSASNGGNLQYGVYGEAFSGETTSRQHCGVFGKAENYSLYDNFGGYFTACDSENNIGVYAEVCDTTDGVAGYFAGSILTSQSPIALSDESIKTDLSEVENPMEIINQLQPKEYHYNTSDYPHLHLKNEKSFGFVAQDVQQILPSIVQTVHHPAKFDTLGQQISPPEDLLGVQYQELIAILTAGMKEQQSTIEAQNEAISNLMDQMNDLQNQIDNCCSGTPSPKNFGGDGNGSEDIDGLKGSNTLDQNVPNPFRAETSISYSLEQGGKVMLNIYDKNGKILETLVEGVQSAGTYRYIWNASGQPAGLYHYALYVDGELLMKKAIKLND